MNDSNKAKWIAIALISAALAAGCSSNNTANTSSPAAAASASASKTSSSGAAAAASVKLASLKASEQAGFDDNDSLITWSADSSTAIALNASGAAVTGSGASADGGVVTIKQAGTYVVNGTVADGQIVVDAPEDADVHLVLNGANITKNDGPAIYVKQADKTIVTLQEGTDNAVSDGATYADTSEEAPTAAIFSKSDLTFNGTGKLTVTGKSKDGITGKDDLKIMSGTIDVQAADDGVIGRDLVAVKDGTVTVKAGGDGVKSTNDADADKGYVAIVGGTFDITSENDGIQAASTILVGGGTYNIVSGGGYANSTKTHADNGPGGFRGQQGSQTQTQSATTDSESSSAKGLKATGDIAIADGNFKIDAADDTIHSNANLLISGGQYVLASGDDGMHADNSLSVSNGTVNITNSYEGIESADIAISGGNIHLASQDDGVNVSGGKDGSAAGGSGGDSFSTTDGMLAISGGYLYVNAGGDGLDSNGSATISGGTAIVNGPTDNGNGPLDYNGTFEQSGGYLIAAGSSGMAQAPSEDSSQRAIQMTFPNTLEAGTLVTLTDSSGKALTAFTPVKTFSSIVISSPNLKAGESYTLSTGGKSTGTATDGLYDGGETGGSTKVVTFTLGDKVTYLNESGVTTAPTGGFGGGGGGRGHGPGGQRPDQMPNGQNGAQSSGQDPANNGTTAANG